MLPELFVIFFRRWIISKDVNVKNQVQIYLIFEVKVIRSSLFPRECHIFRTGVVGGSIAAATQSAVYGGATGGLFSILQSAGAAGIGIFGNTLIASTGAGVGAGFAAAATTSSGQQSASINKGIKIIGIIRESSPAKDCNDIKKFVEAPPDVDAEPNLIQCTARIKDFLNRSLQRAVDKKGERMRNLTQVHLPAVLVYLFEEMHTAKKQMH